MKNSSRGGLQCGPEISSAQISIPASSDTEFNREILESVDGLSSPQAIELAATFENGAALVRKCVAERGDYCPPGISRN